MRGGWWHRIRLVAGSLGPGSHRPHDGRRRLAGAALVIALAAGAAWALWPERSRPAAEREAFEAALADLAAAPALRYTTSLGEIVVPYEATATGEVQAHAPDIAALPGDIATDLLFVDNKLFVRITGSLDPADLGLDPSNPAVREALENVESREGGLGSGEWVTSVSEYDGPILRDGMSPVGVATRLTDLLVETPDDRIRRSPEPIDGTPALVAETPDGELYVSASRPHRVLRFATPAAPGAEDGAPPATPSIPEMPPIPDPGGGGNGGDRTDRDGRPAPGEAPGFPELPPVPDPPGRALSGQTPTTPAPPTPSETDHTDHTDQTDGSGRPDRADRPSSSDQPAQPAVPDAPGGDAPLVQQLGGGAAQVDLEVLTGDDARRVYDEIAATTEELVDAEDGVLQYSDDEMALSLARALESGEALRSCDAESCEVRADATLVHGRGNEVPTVATFAMTVDGEPAGACTARGEIPVSGTGPLACTNDSDEWAAAYRRGAEIGVEVREIEAMAFSPDDVETVTADIEAHAAAAIGADERRSGLSDLQVSGFAGRRAPGAASTAGAAGEETPAPDAASDETPGPDGAASATPSPDPTPSVPTLGGVLDELGIPRSAWDELAGRAGRPRPGVGASETITVADLALLEQTILQGVHAWHGGRLLDALDPASFRRVIERALAARTRTDLHRAIAVLNAAYHVVWTSDLAPGRADSLARGGRVFLDVAEDSLTDGDHRVDLSELGLDAAAGRVLDIAYVTRNGWHFEAVLPDVRQARTAEFARRVALLQDAVGRGLGTGLVDVRQADGLDGLFTDGVPAPPFGGAVEPARPPSPDNQPEGPPVTVSPGTEAAAQRARERNTPLGQAEERAIRSMHRVNESAEVIAAAGYRVIRDPEGPIDDDLAVGDESNIVEHKAPQGDTSMRNFVNDQLTGEQSPDYVVNLNDRSDPQRSLAELRDAVARHPRSRVESITAVVGNEVVPVYPMPGSPVDVVAGEPPAARRSGPGASAPDRAPAAARRPALGLRVPGTEFTGEQVRAIRDTVDEQRDARRRLPRAVREDLRTPQTMRRVVEPGMNRRGVPFRPTVCTCPPCGATPTPGV